MSMMDEMRAILLERAEHVRAIHKIDAYLGELRMAMNTRQPTNSHRGRPEVTIEKVVAALAIREPMSSDEIRKATGVKKSTLEAALKRMADAGQVIRNPTEWRGPNGNYRYARTADAFTADIKDEPTES